LTDVKNKNIAAPSQAVAIITGPVFMLFQV